MINKTIAVTGGIGSGKTAVMGILKEQGFNVLSCDEINGELLERRWVKKKIQKIFPSAVKGRIKLSLDRRALSEEVFSDPEKLNRLNALMHPMILREVKSRARGVTFVEVPLLFECGLEREFDGVIVVLRDDKDRIESVKKRSALTEEEITARMNNQTDYKALDLKDYVVIYNDEDISDLEIRTVAALKKILK